MDNVPNRMRLDKWLWAARFFKTRAVAAQAIDGGRIQVAGERVKRAKLVQVGDAVRIRRGPLEYKLTILQLSERRGPAKVAAALYEEDMMTRRAREDRASQLRAAPAAFFDGKGRPSKKQRRDLDRFKRSLPLIALLAVPHSVAAQAPALDNPLPVDTLVTVGTLENGLRYYIRENIRPENRAELRLVVRTGSVLEDDDQQGLAHFVEHMAFNGTRHFAKQDLVNYLELTGMRFGPDLNAYTNFDETVYMLHVPTDSQEIFETAFQILQDWAEGLTLDSVEIDKERGVVIEEWRLGQGAWARLRDRQFPIIFRGSRYADRLPIGKREILESFDHEALRRFYRDWYRPDLMAVIAVGDFDAGQVQALVHRYFGPIAPHPSPRERPTFAVPDHDEPLFAIATDPEATGSNVSVLFKQALRNHGTYGAFRQNLVEALFTSMLNARFFELSQQADPPFLGASSGQGRFIGAKEVFSLGAAVSSGGIERGLEALLTEAERVARFGFTVTELERHKIRRLRFLERAYDEREKTNSGRYAGEYVRSFLVGEAIPGIELELALHREFLPEIETEEVNRLARQWITPHNRVIVVSAPDKADVPVPTREQLELVFDRVVETPIEPYVDAATDAPLVATMPTPSPVIEEHTLPEIGVTVWRLANGVDVFLKPTDFKDDEILFDGTSPGGYSLASDENHVSAYFSDVIVAQSGVGPFNAVDLEKVLTGTAVRVRPWVGATEEGLSGSASPKDVETMFQLIHLYFVEPREDSTTFMAVRSQFLSFAEDRQASPDAAFRDTIQVTMAQHHPRERPLTPELVEAIDLGNAVAFYRDRFADASDFTFFFVGNMTLDSIRPLVETYLGGLPSIDRVETWRDVGIDPPTGVVERAVYRGLEPKSRTEIIFTGVFDDSRRNRYALRSMAASLQIRLREVLREDLGGTYSIAVHAGSSIAPDTTYSVHISFGAAPQRLDDLTQVVFREIAALNENGPTDSTVQKVREAQRRSRETNLRQNRYWIGQLVAAHRYGTDPLNILTYEELIDALNTDTIRDAARRYLRTDNYVRVSLYPERQNP